MTNPIISIIVPTYNAETFIKKTIESILNQSFSNFECLIINDGSTDGTVDVINKFNDNRIRLFTINNTGGPSIPRNIGIKNARGKYCFFFDSDDLMEPSKLQEYLDVFKKFKNADFIFSDFSYIDENDKIICKSFLDEYQGFRYLLSNKDKDICSLSNEGFSNELVKASFIGTSSVAFKTEKLLHKKLFDESLQSGDDVFAWISLSKSMRFYFINKVLHKYRERKNNISHSNVERLLKNKIAVLNSIISEAFQNKNLVKDCLDKRAEYNFNLGFHHSQKCNYKTSLKYYWQAFQDKPSLGPFVSIIKTYIRQAISIVKKGQYYVRY